MTRLAAVLRRLPVRFSLRVTAPAVLLLAGLVVLASAYVQRMHDARDRVTVQGVEDVRQLLDRTAHRYEFLLTNGDGEELVDEVGSLGTSLELEHVFVVDDRGLVLASLRQADIGRPVAGILRHDQPGQDARRAASIDRAASARESAVEQLDGGGNVVGAAPLKLASTLDGERTGALYVEEDLGHALAAARTTALRDLLEMGAFVVFAILVIWTFFDLVLARRLERIGEAATRLSAGQSGARAGIAGGDEVARLGASFDAMAAELERREAAHAESEQRYRELVEHLPAVVFRSTLEADRFPYVSPGIEKLLGWTPAEWQALESPWQGSLHPEDVERVLADTARAETEKTGYSGEYRMIRRDGTSVWVFDESQIVEVDGVPEWRGILVDATREHELEERLRQVERLESVGRLAGGVAHDFNNLLTAIGGYAELALTRAGEDAGLRADLDEIRATAGRGAALTHQLLAFGRRQPRRLEVLDLNEVVRSTLPMLTRLIGEDIVLETRLATEPCPVEADRSQLDQVVLNLAVNARDAMPDGGVIAISTRRVPGPPRPRIELCFADTGTGIDPAVLPNVFDPFFTTKEVGRGTGLGLATVHGIVEQAGGRVDVSSSPGSGAVFTISLPPATRQAAGDSPAAAGSPGRGTETILVVEDEAGVRRVAVRLLQNAGYRVLEAESGPAALRVLGDERPDALLTDVVMPGMPGPELARRARALRPELAVVFMTGYAPEDQALETAGRHRVVGKPFAAADLAEAIRDELAAAAA